MDTPAPGSGRHPKTRFWLLLIAGIAALCVLALVALHFLRQPGQMVYIYQNGSLTETLPLSEDRTLTLPADNGGYNVVVIENGAVRVSEASCPDQICVRHSPTHETGDPIVCLPNHLVVKIAAAGETDLDGAS